MQNFRYHPYQIAVHWLSAIGIIFLLATGTLVLSELPNDAGKIGNLRIHMIVGALIGALVFLRIFMRKRLPQPLESANNKWAKLGHMSLNLIMLLLALSGFMLALQSGALEVIFAGGDLPEDFKQFTPRKVHGIASRVAIGLVVLHVSAALYHQFVIKDNLLSRMGLFSKNSAH